MRPAAPIAATVAATLGAILIVGMAHAVVDQPRDTARLRGLDKVTARTTTFDVPVGTVATFGTLTIRVDACFATPPTATPESAAFLVIVDAPPNGQPASLFSGWMFASTPSVSALDHAVYDVWVIACLDAPAPAAAMEGEAADADQRGAPRRRP